VGDVLGNIGALAIPGEHERLVTTLLMSDIVDWTVGTAPGRSGSAGVGPSGVSQLGAN
jgi:hypothetical protein